MALFPNGGSQLTHLVVAIFPYPGYLPSWKCHWEGFGRQPFSFALTACLLSLFLFFHLISLSPSFPHCPTCFSSLIIQSCVKLSVSRSPGNRLTFALGYCSHLLALKYLNIQNPTLHLRHGQISAATIPRLRPEYMAMWSAFMNVFYLFHKPGAGHMWHWANMHYVRCFAHISMHVCAFV